jgi:hypothetical protein
VTGVDERQIPVVGQDHMVEYFYAHDLSGAYESECEGDVIHARCWIAGRVVVKEDDRSRRRDRGLAKHFSRVDHGRVERADRHDFDANDPVPGIQHQEAELFHCA